MTNPNLVLKPPITNVSFFSLLLTSTAVVGGGTRYHEWYEFSLLLTDCVQPRDPFACLSFAWGVVSKISNNPMNSWGHVGAQHGLGKIHPT